ncbi:hypothetical protein FIV42_03165 [Persicimonas caeni]|uniref:TolC family protein n=1 Tax=Persicimonas caeni TaxID=2292766 RepID=A0A4Y6PN94_PERCE|nr:hypothetical protein [Persicimonas caeni]QDG49771.1 hypothetical protein FIV42_03165 [Persicimonas caeni]QED30992.1 hypothetical protein FRD00_03160 [Persicimonas caeni]
MKLISRDFGGSALSAGADLEGLPPIFALLALVLLAWPTNAAGQATPKAVASQLASEPSVAQTRSAALRANGYSRGDLDEWSSRARWSHLLPDVEGEVAWLDQRDKEARYREDLETAETGAMYRDSARNDFVDDTRLRTIYAVELEWDLSGLIYDKSEPTIAREVRRRRDARRELLVEVGEAYYLRRRYLTELILTPTTEWKKRIELRLEADRQTARLDALTGGWFSRALSKARQED